MTSNYFDKSKYSQIHNAMYKRFRILNSDRFSRVKKSNPVKYNNYQYFPIESDNSKIRGRTIYLATQDEENDNKDNTEKLNTEPEQNSFNSFNNKLLNKEWKYIAQRTIFFSYIRKYNFTLNKGNLKNNNQIHISDIKIYDVNKSFNETEENLKLNNINNNQNENKFNFFNKIEARQITSENQNNENNNIYRISAYKKKKTLNQYRPTTDENQNQNEQELSTKDKVKSEIINKFSDFLRNRKKIVSLNTEDKSKYDNKTLNIDENKKAPISKNSSMNEYLNITTMPNVTNLNRSLDEVPQNNNKNLFYQPINGNIFDNIDNSKIMEKKFLEGIKNQQRRISLLKAMDRYNRFKCRGKFNINNNNNDKIENIQNNQNIKIKTEIKVNEEYNKDKDELNNENNNSQEEEIENENEFSFNSELRKNDKKNHLEEIIAKNNNNNNQEDININKNNSDKNEEREENEEKEEIKKGDNLIEKIKTNIENEKQISQEKNGENEEINHEEILKNNNQEEKIEEENKEEEHEKEEHKEKNEENLRKENPIMEKVEENIEEKDVSDMNEQKEKEKEEFTEKENYSQQKEYNEENVDNIENKEIISKEEPEKIIKPEINISIDHKEDIKKEKIIPEINISIDNKDSTQENKNDISNNNNSSSNNIINNSINININNNDSFQKNEIREQKQYMQLNNIKYKNNLKPGYFIRKVVREEHYYVDENGKEKILQVKQEFINNEDKKKMKTKNPHKKKFINTGKKIYYNNINKTFNKNKLDSTLNKEDKLEKIEGIKNEIDKNNESFEENNNIIDISTKKEKQDVDYLSTKGLENKPEIIIEKKVEFKDPLVNDNLSSASGPLIYPDNNYNYFKSQENNENTNYNKPKNNNNSIYKRRDKDKNKENNIINISHLQTDSNIITINRSKNLETKPHLTKPITKNNYLSDFQLTSSEIKKISTIKKALNDTNKIIKEKNQKEKEKEKINSINIKPILNIGENNFINYIKVNKTEKYKKPNPETYHKLNLNAYSLYSSNTHAQPGKRRRESSKNHTYHEINLTTTKNNNNNDNKLSSNSLSHYFNEGNDELNMSTNTNKISTNSNNITERNYIHRYTVNSNNMNNNIFDNEKNIEIRTTRFHRNIKDRKELNNSVNKEHHRYYESKSIKKRNSNNHVINNHQYSLSKNIDDSDKKEYQSKNVENINKKDKGYFYSYYDINKNNNSQTAKKSNRTTTYYH